MPLKLSINQYRNIKGVYFQCWTADQSEFEAEKAKAKELGLKTRIIDGQMYREVKQDFGTKQ